MNTATFNTLVSTLGLTAAEISRRLDVNLRTVQRWLSGESPVPPFAAEWIGELGGWCSTLVDELVSAADDALEDGEESFLLTRHQTQESLDRVGFSGVPVSVHSAAVGMAAIEMAAAGIEPVVRYSPVES